MIHALLLAAALSFGTCLAQAQDLSETDRAAIVAAVDGFVAAMDAQDHDVIAQTVPPRMIAHLADRAGVEVEAVRTALIAEMRELSGQAVIVEYRIDPDRMAVGRLDDGLPYALLPTETVVQVDGRKVRVSSQSLALQDAGEWFLVRVSDPQQVTLLHTVYPGFAEMEFAPSTTELLD